MPKNKPPYKEVDHTADLCLYVSGANLEELFTHAAQGMFDLMRCTPTDAPREAVRREIALTGFDIETLLVDWLTELLYANETQDEVYQKVTFNELDATHLVAIVQGETNHPAGRGIKAVTFSGLLVDHTESEYETTITFDV